MPKSHSNTQQAAVKIKLADTKSTEIQKEEDMKLTIIGAGKMGTGITQAACQTEGIECVVLVAKSSTHAEKARTALAYEWKKIAKKNAELESKIHDWQRKLQIIDTLLDAKNSSFIIEALPEKKEVKIDVFSRISEVADENCIIATNTSSLSVTELARHYKLQENVVGMHFFNPATRMALVEITSNPYTTERTIEKTESLAKLMGKTPIRTTDSPGFIVNRLLIPMINEAIMLLAEHTATAEDIDKAMKLGANHPIGPLALSDIIGNDVVLSIMESLHSELGDPKYRPSALLKKMVRANKLGRKTQEGFFKY